MATGGQLTILNPNDQTNLDFPPISPIDGSTAVIENSDKRLTKDLAIQKGINTIIEILNRPTTTIAKTNWVHGMIQGLLYSVKMEIQINKQHNSDRTFDNVHNSSISDCTDIKQTVDNSDIGDPNESKTETIDENMQDQTRNINNEDQDNSEFESTEIVHIDNNTQEFNSPIDYSDHNSSVVTQAEISNIHKESKAIESEDEIDSKPLNLKALTLMLAQSMTWKILKP